jgi:peptidyl-tRNA hydrolase, PTH1 family
LVVGLGNPGADFVGTRHNVGADVVAALSERHQGRLKSEKGLRSEVTTVTVGGRRVLLAVPLTFMNESGLAVGPLVRRSGIDDSDGDGKQGSGSEGAGPRAPGGGAPPSTGLAGRLVIVHDELDLPTGRIKIKSGGGNAGNNGLKSIESHLHTNGYLRVRVGIGKPPGRQPGADYVLRRPGSAERAILNVSIEEAADAVELIVTHGVEVAMNRVNTSA